MKKITFKPIEKPKNDAYGELVKKTAKLIKRPFFQTFQLMKTWEPSYAQHLFDECITRWREKGFESASHMWWTERGKKAGKDFNKKT